MQTGVHRSIIFGEVFGDRGRITPRVQAIADVMAPADIQVTPVADGRVPIWDKFVYLAPFSGFTGAARLPIGGDLEDPARAGDVLRRRARSRGARRGRGRRRSPRTASRRWTEYMDNIPPTTRSSLLIDLEMGKRIEVEALQGAAVRRGREARRADADHRHAVRRAEAVGERRSTAGVSCPRTSRGHGRHRRHGNTELADGTASMPLAGERARRARRRRLAVSRTFTTRRPSAAAARCCLHSTNRLIPSTSRGALKFTSSPTFSPLTRRYVSICAVKTGS